MTEPVLTQQGRQALEKRAQHLREVVIPELASALSDRTRDGTEDADYDRALHELAQIEELVANAKDAANLPDDPNVVELGDLVRLRYEDGEEEELLIVHPAEAPLDDMRISIDSPLAQAVLGRRVGDTVTVQAPRASYPVTVLSAAAPDA